jgi:MarR family transcriptional regulator, organic hydroperoxide resistance regulator
VVKVESGVKVPHLELEGVDEVSARVFRAFMTVLRLHRRHMTRVFAECGQHPGQAVCLHVIAMHQPVTQRDLADALHLSRPTVSRMLRGMEKAGLVERRTDSVDQRLTRVSLTSAGEAAEREQRTTAAEVVNGTIGTLPEADRRELARLLETLAASFSTAIEARAANGEGSRP